MLPRAGNFRRAGCAVGALLGLCLVLVDVAPGRYGLGPYALTARTGNAYCAALDSVMKPMRASPAFWAAPIASTTRA